MKVCQLCNQKPSSVLCKNNQICFSCSKACPQTHKHDYLPLEAIIQQQDQSLSSNMNSNNINNKSTLMSTANFNLKLSTVETHSSRIHTERLKNNNSLERYTRRKKQSHQILMNNITSRATVESSLKTQHTSRVLIDLPKKTRNKGVQTESIQQKSNQYIQTTFTIETEAQLQATIQKLKLKIKDQKEKALKTNENYKKKLELIRSYIKPEPRQIQRLTKQNEELKAKVKKLTQILYPNLSHDSSVVFDF